MSRVDLDEDYDTIVPVLQMELHLKEFKNKWSGLIAFNIVSKKLEGSFFIHFKYVYIFLRTLVLIKMSLFWYGVVCLGANQVTSAITFPYFRFLCSSFPR